MIKINPRPHVFFNHLSRVLIFLILIGLVLRLVNLNQSLWLDEAAQALESAGPLAGLFKIYADFMPPLFHILLHFWMRISQAETWMRLLSVMFGLGTIYYTYLIGKHLFSNHIAFLATIFLVVSPFHIYYSQELRPYSLATFLSMVTTYYLLKASYKRYLIACILLIYSLYTTPFLLIAHGSYLAIFDKEKLTDWLKTMMVVSFAFLPWLPTFYRQLSGGSYLTEQLPGWSTAVSVPAFKALPLTLAKFMLGRITIDNKFIYGSIFFLLLILVFYLVWQSWLKKRKLTLSLLIFITVPIMSLFLISFIIPVFAPQRVLFTLPFFLILLASGIDELKGKLKYVALLAVFAPSIFGLTLYYTNPRFQREQWRQATAFVEEKADDKTEVLFAFPEPFAPFLWYREDERLGYGVIGNFVTEKEDLERLSQLLGNKEEIFYFYYLSELTDPRGKIPSFIDNGGFVLSGTYDFSGVGFVYEYKKELEHLRGVNPLTPWVKKVKNDV